MKQKIVFISSQVKPRKLSEFLAQKGSAFRIILVDADSLNKFGEFDVESIKPYREKVKRENNYWHIAMEWMDEWNRKTQFYKMVMYEGFSLWWFERFGFHLWLQETLADIDAIKDIVGVEKPEQIFLIEVSSYWRDIIQCMARQVNMPLEMIEQMGIYTRLSNNYVSWLTRIKRAVPLIVGGLRTIQGVFRILRSKFEGMRQNQTKILMFTDSLSWQRLKTSQGGKPHYFDVQLGLVFEGLLRRGVKVVAFDAMSHSKDGFRTFLQKKYPYIPLEGYYGPYLVRAFNRVRKERQKAVSTWEDIKKEPNLRQDNFYKDIDITSLILKRLHLFIIRSIPAIISNIEFGKSILNSEKPDAVVIKSEYFFPGQNLIVAAKMLRIPIIGFQHGMIHERHIGYVYPKDADRETIPLPNKMAVFGNYYKEILSKQSVYKESQVEVTGQSRMDFLTQKSFGDIGGTASSLSNFPRGKRILLFTSQGGIEQFAAPVLMEGFSQLGDDYFLIIKLHPGESYPAISYEEAARKYGVENFIIVKQVDLYELLTVCDLHIGVFSTVLSEAVVFSKPNLMLTIPGSVDIGRWMEQGVALNISDFANLKEAVEAVLEDKKTKEELQRARENYIQRHYYRLDGKATERICNLILSQIGSE